MDAPADEVRAGNRQRRSAVSGAMYDCAFHIGESHDVAFSPAERTLLAVTESGLDLWDVATASRIRSRRAPSIGVVDFSPDATRVLASTANGDCLLLDASTLE